MNTYTEVLTVKNVSMGVISFTDQSGVDISFYPNAKPGDKLIVTIDSATNDVVYVGKAS